MALKDIIISSLTKAEDSMKIARKSAEYLRTRYGINMPDVSQTIHPGDFSGGEFNPEVLCDLKGKHVFLFAVPTDPANILNNVSPGEMKSRAEFAANAAKEWGAAHVTLVATDLYFSRADKGPEDFSEKSDDEKKKLFKGKGNLARAQAKAFMSNGIDRVLTLHLHSGHVQESYGKIYGRGDVLMDLSPVPLLIHYLTHYSNVGLNKNNGSNIVLLLSDLGAKPIGDYLYDSLHRLGYTGISKIQFSKTRKVANDPNKVEIYNPQVSPNYTGLEGKTALTIDDMDDTAGTRKATCVTIKEDGIEIEGFGRQRPANIVIYGTHAVHAGLNFESAMQTIAAAEPSEVIYTNSHPSIERNMTYYLKKVTSVIRTAHFFGEVIRCLEEEIPIGESYTTNGILDMAKISKFAVQPFRRSEHMNNLR
ncbi:hypothetical protein COV19_01405 [Candidatus Woesearchaeota archaeon CG10_big_fil_rev_8_21_14_0_10_44_13]|nr:MAG: hypothetical protein COV19_01405 [Candidatus Woesearchaeota archaeon CG10_big_fil_rev_8_21_14_0_10_44_13]